jgi:hypothetical protein
MDAVGLDKLFENKKKLTKSLRHALREHKELTKHNYKDRQRYLEYKIEELKERNNNDHITIKREENRNDFKIIKKTLKGDRSKGIKHLDIPDPNNEDSWIRILDQQLIEKNLLNCNIVHFGQARLTPFASNNLVQVFGYGGVNNNSTDLIENGIIPTEVNDENIYTKKFIEKLSQGKVAEIEEDITFEEFVGALNKWNEKTTTSPSGRHLGHYRLLIKFQVVDQEDNSINYSNIILKTYYNIVMCAMKLGAPLDRWREITTCMIEKKPGVARIDRL